MRFDILGALSVTDAGQDVAITAGRDRVVLAMLLLHPGRIVGVEDLIDAVWEDRPPATARAQLQTCVSRLRRALPPGAILTDPGGYGIRPRDDELDAVVFARLVAQARAAADTAAARKLLREALDLWRGPALTGLDARAVRRRAAVLDEQHAVAIEAWVDLELAHGSDRDLVAELTGLVEQFPLRERLRVQLMLSLHRVGRQADALAEYRRARELLRAELGLEPGPALQELHRRILAGDVAQQPVARAADPVRCLPRTVGDFTGRDDAARRLLDAAVPGLGTGPTVLVVDGMAGSGKTTLAVHVAHRLAESYPDAQLFVDLQGHSDHEPIEPGTALQVLLRQLGLDAERIPVDLDGRVDLWRKELAGRRVVVVLDNAASSAQLARLLPIEPGSVSLITSRRRLVGLDGVHPESLPVLDEPAAVTLLAKIVGARVAAEPAAALEVVRRCGCLPLAIRLAGARLAHRPRWQVADLVRRLGESALPELAAEDRTVASAFALSYEQLAERVQRTFRLLGLYPGERFGPLVAAALADLPLHDARDDLDDLVDMHLVEEPEPDRYRLHDLVRQYATTVAESQPSQERRAALSRLIDLHLHAGAELNRAGESGIAPQDFPTEAAARPDLVARAVADPAWLEWQRPDLVALIRAAAAIGEPGRAWLLARVNWHFLYTSNYSDDLISVQRQGLAAAEEARDERGVALMNNYLASGYYRTGRFVEALQCMSVMLDFQVRSGDLAAEARARSNVAGVLYRLGRMREGIAETERSYRIWQRIRHDSGIAFRNSDLAMWKIGTGRYAEALRHARLALQCGVELGSERVIGSGLLNIGHARMQLGDLDAAERILGAALGVARKLRSRPNEGEILDILGTLALRRGNPAAAVEQYLAALNLEREHRQLPGVARASNSLGAALLVMDDKAGAAELHRRALAISRQASFAYEEGRALAGLADCALADDPQAARRYWQLALDLFARMGVPERHEVERRLARLDSGADLLRSLGGGGRMEA